jgi:hypothetical protein
MDVEDAVTRGVENGLRQDQSIGHDHGGIGVEGLESRLFLRTLETLWREHKYARLLGRLMHRRFTHAHAAPGRTRRLGVNGGNLVACIANGAKRRHGEVRRSHEDNAHHRLTSASRICSGHTAGLN